MAYQDPYSSGRDAAFQPYASGGEGYNARASYASSEKLPLPPKGTGLVGQWRKQDKGRVFTRVRRPTHHASAKGSCAGQRELTIAPVAAGRRTQDVREVVRLLHHVLPLHPDHRDPCAGPLRQAAERYTQPGSGWRGRGQHLQSERRLLSGTYAPSSSLRSVPDLLRRSV